MNIRCIIAVALILFGKHVFPQEAKPKLLPLKVTSNRLQKEELQSLTSQLLEKLQKYPGFDVLPPPEADPMDLMIDSGCTDLDAECLQNIGKSAGADKVLYAEVIEEKGRFKIQIRLVDVKTGESKVPEGETEAKERTADLLALAVERVLGPEPKKAELVFEVSISTEPAGADVYVGNDFVGSAPVKVRLKQGVYNIRLSRVGYEEKAERIEVSRDKPLSFAFTLNPIELPKPAAIPPGEEKKKEKKAFYKTWWFWTTVGVVVAGTGVGAFFLAQRHGETVGQSRFSLSPDSARNDPAVIRASSVY
jgi:TolB-like protein